MAENRLCAEKGRIQVLVDVQSVAELNDGDMADLADVFWILCRNAGVSARQMLDSRVAESIPASQLISELAKGRGFSG